MWKAVHDPKYSFKMPKHAERQIGLVNLTRGATRRDLDKFGVTYKAKESFAGDATKTWDKAFELIRQTKTLAAAKVAIKELCRTLPLSYVWNQLVCKFCVDGSCIS
jgi:hypothetical protein